MLSILILISAALLVVAVEQRKTIKILQRDLQEKEKAMSARFMAMIEEKRSRPL